MGLFNPFFTPQGFLKTSKCGVRSALRRSQDSNMCLYLSTMIHGVSSKISRRAPLTHLLFFASTEGVGYVDCRPMDWLSLFSMNQIIFCLPLVFYLGGFKPPKEERELLFFHRMFLSYRNFDSELVDRHSSGF
jgi:hypothetical protein